MDHDLHFVPFHPRPPIGWITSVGIILCRKIGEKIKSDQENEGGFFHL
jgi:hypothetical protein